ncbi:hypothetical protein, partial [Streptomyces griseocarneus]
RFPSLFPTLPDPFSSSFRFSIEAVGLNSVSGPRWRGFRLYQKPFRPIHIGFPIPEGVEVLRR